MLKKFTAIAIALCFLMVQTPLQQLLRLPMLYAHFMEHKQHEPGMDFEAFIHLHYSAHHAQDADHESDMQLPFKCPDVHLMSHISLVPEQMDFMKLKPNPRVQKIATSAHDKDQINPYQSSIFQPPRLS